jgi:hypothetical protein
MMTEDMIVLKSGLLLRERASQVFDTVECADKISFLIVWINPRPCALSWR